MSDRPASGITSEESPGRAVTDGGAATGVASEESPGRVAGASSGPAPVAAVIGSPIAHSLSPVIHRAAFEAAGLEWSYVAFEVAPGAAAAAVAAMRALGLAGLSVTTPHKDAVAAAVDRLDPAAAALATVNTVAWDGDELVGYSTDGAGFVASLGAEGIDIAGARAVVIGAGGAARSVIDALGRAGAADIAVLNRSPERGRRAATLARSSRVGTAGDLGTADLVVNATSVGMGSDPVPVGPADLPCDPGFVAAGAVVADLVYQPLVTPWLAAARSRGLRTVDGIGMLVHQAALQQQIWTGHLPDATLMRMAAEAELERRAGTSRR